MIATVYCNHIVFVHCSPAVCDPLRSSSEDWATEVFSTLKSAIPVTFEPSVLDFREQYDLLLFLLHLFPHCSLSFLFLPLCPSHYLSYHFLSSHFLHLSLSHSLSMGSESLLHTCSPLRPTGMPALREVKIITLLPCP